MRPLQHCVLGGALFPLRKIAFFKSCINIQLCDMLIAPRSQNVAFKSRERNEGSKASAFHPALLPTIPEKMRKSLLQSCASARKLYAYTAITESCFSSSHKTSVVGSTFANKRQSTHAFPRLQSVKILEQVRERVRYFYCSMRTKEAYLIDSLLHSLVGHATSSKRNFPEMNADWLTFPASASAST